MRIALTRWLTWTSKVSQDTRRNPSFAVEICLLTLISFSASPASLPFPNTSENIHLGLVTDNKIANLGSLSGKVDYIYAAATSAGVPPKEIYLDAYLTYDRDDTNKPLAWFQTMHPDWIVYQCDRSTVSYEFGDSNVPLDITNSAVRAYQVQEIAGEFARVPPGFTFNGLGWDNLVTINAHKRCGIKAPAWRALYSGKYVDAAYQKSILAWAAATRATMLRRFPGKGMSMNLSTGPTGCPAPKFAVISPLFAYVDLVLDERGFTAFGSAPIVDDDWQNEVATLERINRLGKAFFLPTQWDNVSSDAGISHSQIDWSLANYLLVKGQHSYVYIYPLRHGIQTYGTFFDRAEYHAQIGRPTSRRYAFQGVQRRDYSSGLVLVNASGKQSYVVKLSRTYNDFWGNAYNSVNLAPATAAVLFETANVSRTSSRLQEGVPIPPASARPAGQFRAQRGL